MSSSANPLSLEHSVNDAAYWLAESEHAENKPILVQKSAETFVVSPVSVQAMVGMSLGQLPLAAIAIPQGLAQSGSRQNCVIRDEPETLDLSNTLTTYFSSYVTAALYELQALCKHANIQAYIIGGQIRDILLQRDRRFDMVDVDVTVEANALEAAQRMVANSRNFTVVECFPEFGTATLAYKDDIKFDLASTRQEHYASCGALPVIDERGVPLSTDIGRRDFTVNTLAMSVHHLGQVWDYTDGLTDINNGTIRVLHPLSFYEDPSRILRAYKFASRLEFTLSPLTEYLIHQFMVHGGHCYPGGGDRIRSELAEFLSLPSCKARVHWLAHFKQLGVPRLFNMALPQARFPSKLPLPDLESEDDAPQSQKVTSVERESTHLTAALDSQDEAIAQLLARANSGLGERFNDEGQAGDHGFRHFRFLMALWPMLASLITIESDLIDEESAYRQTLKRLEITRQERDILYRGLQLSRDDRLLSLTEGSSPIQVYQLCQGQPVESLIMASLLAFANDKPALTLRLYMVHRYITRLKPIKPQLNGDDLIKMGIPFGEGIGQALEAILFQKLLGRLTTKNDEALYVEKFCLDKTVSDEGNPQKGDE